MKTKWLPALLLTVACAEPPLGFAIEPNRGLEPEFDKAAQVWCEAGCCPFQSEDGPSTLRSAPRSEFASLPPSGEWVNSIGVHVRQDDSPVSLVLILDTISGDKRYQTILHELGHACGCPESEDKNAVMYPHMNGIATLTEEDRACATQTQ